MDVSCESGLPQGGEEGIVAADYRSSVAFNKNSLVNPKVYRLSVEQQHTIIIVAAVSNKRGCLANHPWCARQKKITHTHTANGIIAVIDFPRWVMAHTCNTENAPREGRVAVKITVIPHREGLYQWHAVYTQTNEVFGKDHPYNNIITIEESRRKIKSI